MDPPGNVYVPLPGPCELFRVEDPLVDESLRLQVRGRCGIPEGATAVILQVKVESRGGYPRVKVWASDLPEPAEAVIEGSNASFEDLKAMTAVVTLCAGDRCEGRELRVKGTDAASVQVEAVGYFRPIGSTDGLGSGSGIQFYVESTNNNFFGTWAGEANTTGDRNAFFGGYAGHRNTTGSWNAFFGRAAGHNNTTARHNAFFGYVVGYSNTTGNDNAFFGRAAGYFNTVESMNTFIVADSNLDPGPDPATSPVTNATAIGYRAYVSQSNSLVLGSINAVNGATVSTQVGIGTTAPQRLLHIAGSNAVFRMDRSTNSAAFMLVRTNNSGGVLKNFVIGVNAFGTNQGEFVINDLGTALGGPGERRLTINNDGDVIINGDLITNAGALSFPDYVFGEDYELMPLGELREYVEAEKHLPELPSAEEIQKQGEINVTELQLKLLQKIEELTLYTIQQEARMDQQQATIEQQQMAIEQLQEQNRRVNELISRLEALEKAGVPKP